ncbi:hypothetical protein L3Q82_026346 [Scortum barcoo]|uniref:Uncharacterized protein n=1 Tax=Scortum barcoo TaxID=214431 RepID=A0ACB8WJ58_9TELE|nr:hypothetical protein L3Q82_026346 [Scortum barcoo]
MFEHKGVHPSVHVAPAVCLGHFRLDPLAGRGGSWTDLADPNVLFRGSVGNVWPSPLSGRSSTPHLRKSFSQIPREAGDIESRVDHVLCLHCRRWQFEGCGRVKVSGACRGGNPRTGGGGHRK